MRSSDCDITCEMLLLLRLDVCFVDFFFVFGGEVSLFTVRMLPPVGKEEISPDARTTVDNGCWLHNGFFVFKVGHSRTSKGTLCTAFVLMWQIESKTNVPRVEDLQEIMSSRRLI